MARKFDNIIKQIDFDDKYQCQLETEKIIKDPKYKYDIRNPIIQIKTEDELKKYIYPRIEYFHTHKKNQYNKVSKNNIFIKDIDKILTNKKLSIYDNTDKKHTYNTLDYIFNNFHTALFVQILNNKIHTFVLLSNYKSHLSMLKHLNIVDPSKYKNIDDFIHKMNERYYKNVTLMKKEEDSIYFTDCYINIWESSPKFKEQYYWFYTYQYNLLTNLLKNKKINDIEFILNYKDINMLTKSGEHNPHYHILGNLTTPLNKKYKPFIPILNFGSHNKFADIPIPTNDDWEICTNKIFLGNCRNIYFDVIKDINLDYDNKIPTAIFRGSATGCGTIIKNNPRLKAAYLSNKFYNHPKYGINNNNDGHLYLDAKITAFKTKLKKHYSEKYMNIIDRHKLNLKVSKKLNLSEITNYKYILSIEGNIAAFRLTLELAYNSVILLVKSEFYIWHQPLLKEWIHYVPVKSDLSDVMEKIEWCKNNDDKCKIIAKNARDFFKKYINTNSIYDYMEIILNY